MTIVLSYRVATCHNGFDVRGASAILLASAWTRSPRAFTENIQTLLLSYSHVGFEDFSVYQGRTVKTSVAFDNTHLINLGIFRFE